MSRITLYTVPHTGTHFATKFFNLLGIQQHRAYAPFPSLTVPHWWRCHAAQGPQGDAVEYVDQAIIPARKLVVTARDPYLSAIRWFNPTGTTRPMEKLKIRWDRFFYVLNNAKHPYFVLDIGCREKDRHSHLLDLAEFMGFPYDKDTVRDYADGWKPENSTNTDAKAEYLKTGALPKLTCDGSWDMLDDAVEWYKSLPTNDFGDK